MKSETVRHISILAYLAGNAVTYRHLVRADPSHALEIRTLIENLAISCAWPIYWVL